MTDALSNPLYVFDQVLQAAVIILPCLFCCCRHVLAPNRKSCGHARRAARHDKAKYFCIEKVRLVNEAVSPGSPTHTNTGDDGRSGSFVLIVAVEKLSLTYVYISKTVKDCIVR